MKAKTIRGEIDTLFNDICIGYNYGYGDNFSFGYGDSYGGGYSDTHGVGLVDSDGNGDDYSRLDCEDVTKTDPLVSLALKILP